MIARGRCGEVRRPRGRVDREYSRDVGPARALYFTSRGRTTHSRCASDASARDRDARAREIFRRAFARAEARRGAGSGRTDARARRGLRRRRCIERRARRRRRSSRDGVRECGRRQRFGSRFFERFSSSVFIHLLIYVCLSSRRAKISITTSAAVAGVSPHATTGTTMIGTSYKRRIADARVSLSAESTLKL